MELSRRHTVHDDLDLEMKRSATTASRDGSPRRATNGTGKKRAERVEAEDKVLQAVVAKPLDLKAVDEAHDSLWKVILQVIHDHSDTVSASLLNNATDQSNNLQEKLKLLQVSAIERHKVVRDRLKKADRFKDEKQKLVKANARLTAQVKREDTAARELNNTIQELAKLNRSLQQEHKTQMAAAVTAAVAEQKAAADELQAQLAVRAVKDSALVQLLDQNRDGVVSGAEVEKHIREMEETKMQDQARIAQLVGQVAAANGAGSSTAELQEALNAARAELSLCSAAWVNKAKEQQQLHQAAEEAHAEGLAAKHEQLQTVRTLLNAQVAEQKAAACELKAQLAVRAVKDSALVQLLDQNRDGVVSGAEVEKHIREMEETKMQDQARIAQLVGQGALLESKLCAAIESAVDAEAEAEEATNRAAMLVDAQARTTADTDAADKENRAYFEQMTLQRAMDEASAKQNEAKISTLERHIKQLQEKETAFAQMTLQRAKEHAMDEASAQQHEAKILALEQHIKQLQVKAEFKRAALESRFIVSADELQEAELATSGDSRACCGWG